jgi:hypothetical protein
MALCLPRKRRATSLATRPSTLSVASITNHSCVTSAGLALNVFMSLFFRKMVWRALFHGRCSSRRESLRWGSILRRGATRRCGADDYTKNQGLSARRARATAPGFVIAGPSTLPPAQDRLDTRNPWIPDQVRDDSLKAKRCYCGLDPQSRFSSADWMPRQGRHDNSLALSQDDSNETGRRCLRCENQPISGSEPGFEGL